MTARTVEELLQSVSSKIDTVFGNSPLSNPTANASNNLVKLVQMVMIGQAELEKRIEAFQFQYQQRFIENDALDYLASTKCLERLEDTTSKALIAITGEDCALLQQGSILLDEIEREWFVTEAVTLTTNGSTCAFGFGVVEASASGCWFLKDGELTFDNSNTPSIYSATNIMMLEKGGAVESNDAFRDRISNTGVLSMINGTDDRLQSLLSQVDGVNFARVDSGTFCGETGGLAVVSGGLDSDICETLRLQGSLTCSLLGDTSCDTNCFDGIRFQRPIPVKVDILVTLNCDCPVITQSEAESMILAQSTNFSSSTKISGSTLSKLHPDIEHVQFKLIRREIGCGLDETYIDPFSGDEFDFFTSQAFGINAGVTDCQNESNEYLGTAKFPIYEMPVMNEITFTDCPKVGQCNPCV